MSIKIKYIIIATIGIVAIISAISLLLYINHINNKVNDLNATIAEQKNQIESLNCQISSLEKNVESLNETINITNSYIEKIEKAKEEEIAIKQEVLNTVIEDPDAKEWYEEEIPDSLIQVLLKNSDDLFCD